MLLGFLCLDASVKARVSARLSGGSLRQLTDAMEEFMHYHEEIDGDLGQGNVEEDAKAGIMSRLKGLIDNLRA